MNEKPPSGRRDQDRERRYSFSALMSQAAGRSFDGPVSSRTTTASVPHTVPPLLDGAVAQEPVLDPDLEPQTSVAADPDRSSSDRIDAFQDIIDSEVGGHHAQPCSQH